MTVEKDKEASAEITNTYTQKTGKLTVTKTVTGNPTGADTKKFKVAVKNTETNKYYTQTGAEAESQIAAWTELGAGESLTWENLPEGTYAVEENEEDAKITNWALTVTIGDAVAVSSETPASVTVTNAYTQDVGSLKLKKILAAEAPEEASTKAYKFTVKLKDAEHEKYVQEDGSLSETEYQFTITGAGEISIEDIPVGDYVVEEDQESAELGGYTLQVSDAVNVTVEKDKEASAEITNTYTREEGSLKVSKNVKSDDKNDKTKAFKFKVTLDDKTVAGTFGDMTFKDGVAEFTLKDGESKTATGLLSGVKYTVEEEKADGFTVTKTGDTGTIKANATAEASFTNTKETPPTPTPTPTPGPKIDTRQVRVVKAWKDGDNAGGTRPASVTVHLLADGVDTGLTVQLSAANNWNYVWYDLPVYTSYGNIISYSVAEDPVPGYTAEYSGSMNGGYTITNKKRVIPKTDDTFEALKLQAILLGSMLMAMLSSFLLRKTAER